MEWSSHHKPDYDESINLQAFPPFTKGDNSPNFQIACLEEECLPNWVNSYWKESFPLRVYPYGKGWKNKKKQNCFP